MINNQEGSLLSQLYYDPAHTAGYSGARRLLDAVSEKKDVREWLAGQDTYSLHKKAVKRFSRLHYNVSGIDSLWEADLSDLSSLKQYNDNYRYLLFAIDVLSKYLWVEPIFDKTASSVTAAFKAIFDRSSRRRPDTVRTDRGGEFMGYHTINYLTSQDIKHQEGNNPDIKCSIVERVQRTIKEKMWRYFTHQNSRRYIDVLQDIVTSYNNSYHSSIKMKPVDVTFDNDSQAWKNIQSHRKSKKQLDTIAAKKKRKKKPKYRSGDMVRISRSKGVFEKGYMANFSEEIFKIRQVLAHRDPVVYTLEDLSGEEIDSIFYEPELSLVRVDTENHTWQINEILQTSGRGANKKYFVSWMGWPKKFNSWVSAADMQDL